MKRLVTTFLCLLLAMAVLSSCGNNEKTLVLSNEKETVKVAEASKTISDNHADSQQKGVPSMMTIKISGKEYKVKLEDNITTQDLVKNMPLELNMVRYANHEYYDKLPITPRTAAGRTTILKAGYVYYWNGWNSLVINYIDYDISPYQVVPIGEVTDSSINEVLKNSGEKIAVGVSMN